MRVTCVGEEKGSEMTRFFVTYLRRALRWRVRHVARIALGLALGVGLVITASAASAGVKKAKAGVLSVRPRQTAAIAAAFAGVALLTTACGGGGAPATAPPGSAGGGYVADNADAIPYSQCMRAHGVPNFPDPSPNSPPGKPFGAATLAQASVDPNTPQFQAASAACARLQPPGPTPAQRQQALSLTLRFVACMRAHGVPDFPDPSTANGGVQLSLTPSAVNSPRFLPAEQDCRSIAPWLVMGPPSSKTPK
jgi:hypothetical protein